MTWTQIQKQQRVEGGKKGLQIEIKEDPEGLSAEMCTIVLEFVRRFQYAT
jgi:hypothetical protein